MSKNWKITTRQIEKGAYVVVNFSQLAQVIRQTRKFRQDGYDVLPLNSGTGDPYGVYTTFIPEIFARVADMTQWEKPTGDRPYWRKVTPQYVPSDDGDSTGGGPQINAENAAEYGDDDEV